MEYKIKSYKLSAAQVSNLVKGAIEIYKEGDFVEDYAFNPVDMEINFYAGLFYYTIEGYDKIEDNDEKFNELFTNGVHNELMDKITNAKMAYDLMWKTANEIGSSIGSILSKVNSFIDNIPSNIDDLEKISKNLPKEWEKVFNQYSQIIGKDNIEGGTTIE